MNQAYSGGKNARPKIQSPENFLEALKDLGRSTVSEFTSNAKAAITQDIPASFGFDTSGTLKPHETLSLADLDRAEKRGFNQAESRFTAQLAEIRRQERSRLLQEESEAKKQVQAIREEIIKLAKSMGDLAQEVQVATMQASVNPGVYHKNFYAHLRTVLLSLRQKVESSKNWLATSNHRASKKGFYWSQVSKSGSKFMLSSERYMVTSTG